MDENKPGDDDDKPVEMKLKMKYQCEGEWPKTHKAKPRTNSRPAYVLWRTPGRKGIRWPEGKIIKETK